MAEEGTDGYIPDPKKIEEWEKYSRVIKAAEQRDEKGIVELKLRPKIQETGIVESYILRRNDIEIWLNHVYHDTKIVFTVNRKEWQKNHETLEKILKKKGVTNKDHIRLLVDVLDDNHETIVPPPPTTDPKVSEQRLEGVGELKESTAQILLGLAEEQISDLFLDQFGTPYAAIEIDNHIETLTLKSSRFRNWLCRIFYNSQQDILGSETVTNVLSILKAKAEFESTTRNLSLRVAAVKEDPFTIYYDLTNKDWQVVKITPE
jgi:hypothetical protein